MRYSATLRLHFIQHYMNIQDSSLTKLMDNYYQQPGWEFARTDGGKIKAARWAGDTAAPAKPQQPRQPRQPRQPQRSQRSRNAQNAQTPGTAPKKSRLSPELDPTSWQSAAPAVPNPPRVFIKKKKTMEPH